MAEERFRRRLGRRGAREEGAEGVAGAGLELLIDDDRVVIDNVVWGSFAEKQGLEFDWRITDVEVPLDPPSRYWMCVPAVMAIGLVVAMQRRRRRSGGGGERRA